MIIILVRIAANTTKQDVENYMSPVLKGSVFQKPGYIKRIKILALKDSVNNRIDYHGIVTTDSDVAGERVVKKLNRKAFKGKHIAVRKYHVRSNNNDRSLIKDRRRQLEPMKDVHDSISYTGLAGYHRNFVGSTKDATEFF